MKQGFRLLIGFKPVIRCLGKALVRIPCSGKKSADSTLFWLQCSKFCFFAGVTAGLMPHPQGEVVVADRPEKPIGIVIVFFKIVSQRFFLAGSSPGANHCKTGCGQGQPKGQNGENDPEQDSFPAAD